MNVEFLEREQDWRQNGPTRYWFELNGYDKDTGIHLQNEQFAITAHGPVLDSDSCPLSESDAVAITVRKHCCASRCE